jgi:LysR family transcriptional regulator, hydrogen peroxide-inducible genes activator
MIHLPTLRQLRYLVALEDERHFGRAAQSCHVTQSTLSAGLKELEQILGVTLIDRNLRRVTPTAAGRDIIDRARRILREMEEVAETARAAREPLTGGLHIGVIPTVGPFLLPRALSRLNRDYPALKPYLREEQTALLIEGINDGRFDVLLMAFPYDAPGLETHTLLHDGFWIACPQDHPLTRKRFVTPDEAPRDELLLLEDGHCLREHALAACRMECAPRHEGFRGTSLYMLAHMVALGMGVTLLPDMAVRSGLANIPGVVVRPLTKDAPARRICLAWRKASPRQPEFQMLADVLADALRD